MRAKTIKLPSFQVIGMKVAATVEVFESGLGKDLHHRLLERKHEIPHRKNDHVILLQIYPLDDYFDAKQDEFTHLIGYEVTQAGSAPAGMVHREIEACEYVVCTHEGVESDVHLTYSYLYESWLGQNGRAPKNYDFEIWDERYDPESPANEIDIYVALSEQLS